MKAHTIRYRVVPEARDEHERLLVDVMDDLAASPVPGLRYEVFSTGDDGLGYLHLVAYDKDGRGPLRRPPALARFHEALRERCDGEPLREELQSFGARGGTAGTTDDRQPGSHHDRWRHLHG